MVTFSSLRSTQCRWRSRARDNTGVAGYTYPLSESLALTGSFGASRRKLVEAKGAANDLSFRQFQGLAQLQWTFAESGDQTWYASAGLSINRNNSYLDGDSVLLIVGGGPDGDPQFGYLRLGLGHAGNRRQPGLERAVGIYVLQGIAGLSSQAQLEDFSFSASIQERHEHLVGSHPGMDDEAKSAIQSARFRSSGIQ